MIRVSFAADLYADALGHLGFCMFPYVGATQSILGFTLVGTGVTGSVPRSSSGVPAIDNASDVRLVAYSIKVFYTGTKLDESGMLYHMDVPSSASPSSTMFTNFDLTDLIGNPRSTAHPIVRDHAVQACMVPDSKRDFKEWTGATAIVQGWSPKLVFITGVKDSAPFTVVCSQIVEYAPKYNTSTDVMAEPVGHFDATPPCPHGSGKNFPAVIGHKSLGAKPSTMASAAKKVGSLLSSVIPRPSAPSWKNFESNMEKLSVVAPMIQAIL